MTDDKYPDRYPMGDEQPAQIDCRLTDCRFHKHDGCTNISPAITLNENDKFICWSRKEKTMSIYEQRIYKDDRLMYSAYLVDGPRYPLPHIIGDVRICLYKDGALQHERFGTMELILTPTVVFKEKLPITKF